MILIKNLTKVYKSRAKSTCRALDSINLTLPDHGLVFVLGKSGSGKSTLLNLLGGLDSFDGGDIVSFGNSLRHFKEKDFEAYRSSFVSFIFQDFHLIDELTVLENITLFNSDNLDESLLQKTLDTVGMKKYIHRYPRELSGGQKQRVAIARGIMKDPKVILCDEPTGNLDRKTSEQILKLLKKLSEEKLVLIVSHNLSEAQAFADRIIELADGKVIEDLSREEDYLDELVIEGESATLPYHNQLTKDELRRLNGAIQSGRVNEIRLNGSGFSETHIKYKKQKEKLFTRELGRTNLLRLFKKFFFSKGAAAISTVLLSVIMFGLFATIQSFTHFDSAAALYDSLSDGQKTIAIEKKESGFGFYPNDDLSTLNNEKTYYLYNTTLWTNAAGGSSWDNIHRESDEKNLEELYIKENYGVLICDNDYLMDIYGKDGSLPLVLGSAQDAEWGGSVLITDYFADSIIAHEAKSGGLKYLSYERILGIFVPCSVNSCTRIVGIIDTDYEEKYKEIFDLYEQYKNQEEIDPEELLETVISDPQYITFADDVIMNLGVAYSLNPNFIEDLTLEEFSCVRTTGIYFATDSFEISGKKLDYTSTVSSPVGPKDLSQGEIGIPFDIYNSLYHTNYTEADANKLNFIDPQKIVLRRYEEDDNKKSLLHETEYTVTFLTSHRIVMSEEDMLALRRADSFPTRIYIKDCERLGSLISMMEENELFFVTLEQKNIQQINELIVTFHDLFSLLELVIIAILALYLVYFGIRSIRQNRYQIGVIKALGGRNRDVRKIFVLKTFIIGVIIAVLCAIVSIPFIQSANAVLTESIEKAMHMHFDDLHIMSVFPSLIITDAALMIGIAFFSALIPTLLLKGIKPVEIIKAKE